MGILEIQPMTHRRLTADSIAQDEVHHVEAQTEEVLGSAQN
jgi:hypothetical protein